MALKMLMLLIYINIEWQAEMKVNIDHTHLTLLQMSPVIQKQALYIQMFPLLNIDGKMFFVKMDMS